MQNRLGRVEQVRGEKQDEQQCAEQAGPGLLEPEQQELVHPQSPAGAGIEAFELQSERREAAVAFALHDGAV